jgi:hypothetical protein
MEVLQTIYILVGIVSAAVSGTAFICWQVLSLRADVRLLRREVSEVKDHVQVCERMTCPLLRGGPSYPRDWTRPK